MENTLPALLARILADVDGALACLAADLEKGDLLSSAQNVAYFSEPYLEAIVAAAVEMFRGKNVAAIESLLSIQSESTVEKSIKEIQMTTTKTYHFMATLPENPDVLVVLVTTRSVNLGMGWSSLRYYLPDIGKLCP